MVPVEHLRALAAPQQRTLLDSVDEQLRYQPGLETRNRKPMRPNPVAPWELCVGSLRVYYEIEAADAAVHNLAVGVKEREMDDANQALAEYSRGIDGEALVVTEHVKPVAVLLPLVNADLESVSLNSNPRFLELIENSRLRLAEEGAVSPEDVRRQLGV
jgi:antitoxin (DNA-binding transcriptional repressor) of toxin-antitoxin stability system